MRLFATTRLFSNFTWVMLANFVTGGINFFAMAWFALKLGPTAMGEYAIIVSTLQIISAFLSGGFEQAVIRNPECRETSSAASFATIGRSVMLVMAGGMTYGIFYYKYTAAAESLLWPGVLLLGSMILAFLANLYTAPIAAKLNYRYLSYARLLSVLPGLGVGILLVMKGAGIYGLVVREFITALVALVLYRIESPLRLLPWKITRSGLLKLMHFAVGMWGLNTLERVVFRLDYILVGAIFGKETLGMYFVLRGLVEGVLGFLIAPIQTVLYTYYCRLHDQATLRWLLTVKLNIFYWSGVFGMALVGCYLSPFLVVFLGPAYGAVYPILPSLVLYAGSILWFENAKVWFMAQQMHHKMIVARSIQLMVLSASIYPLAKSLQIFGASIATAAGALSLALTAWLLVNKRRSDICFS